VKWHHVVALALFSASLLAVLYKGFGGNPHEVPFMLKGKTAPPFTLKRLDTGEAISLEQLRGQPVVLNFWATWCGPCQLEHPVLEWASREYGRRATFLGVVFQDSPERAKAYLAKHGGSFAQLIDPDSAMAVDYGVAGVPETYFIDAKGTIVDKHVGPINPDKMSAMMAKVEQAAPRAEAQP
jgi:cytochrome c biogenesis protein CcmG/thiol:disulfide interchange protein DsbE